MKKLKLNLQSIENEVEISDGYHTFDELYDHRITLYIALCRKLSQEFVTPMSDDTSDIKRYSVWRSHEHSDGSLYAGHFILGIGREKGNQITYHIPMFRWEEVQFAEFLHRAPEFDGHTPQNVLERIKNL